MKINQRCWDPSRRITCLMTSEVAQNKRGYNKEHTTGHVPSPANRGGASCIIYQRPPRQNTNPTARRIPARIVSNGPFLTGGGCTDDPGRSLGGSGEGRTLCVGFSSSGVSERGFQNHLHLVITLRTYLRRPSLVPSLIQRMLGGGDQRTAGTAESGASRIE